MPYGGDAALLSTVKPSRVRDLLTIIFKQKYLLILKHLLAPNLNAQNRKFRQMNDHFQFGQPMNHEMDLNYLLLAMQCFH